MTPTPHALPAWLSRAAGAAGSRARRRPLAVGALALAAVLLPLYAASIDIRASRGASITGDEPFYLMTARSLLDDGNLDLRRQYDERAYLEFFDHPDGLWRQSVPLQDGRLLSPHNPGLAVLVMPGLALGGLRGVQIELVALAVVTWVLAFVLAARLVPSVALAWLATLAVAVTATAFVYSSEIYPEMPAALALLIALLLVMRADERPGVTRAATLVAVLSLLPWLGAKYAPLAAIVGGYALWRPHGGARLAFVSLGALSAGAYAWFHIQAFGGLTPYAVNLVYAGGSTAEIVGSHVELSDRAYRLWGLFIDRRFGVARWAPVLLAIPAGLWLLAVVDARRRLIALLIVTQILIATFVAITMMGWWFPGRTLVTVFPLLPVPLALVASSATPTWRIALVASALFSLAVTLALAAAGHRGEIAVAVDPFEMGSPLLRWTAPLFPLYTAWGTDTWLLTATWLGAPAVAAGWWAWRRSGRRGGGRRRSSVIHSSTALAAHQRER